MKKFRSFLLALTQVPVLLLCGFITIYQKTLSPDHGILKYLFPHGFCRFHPTCSEFSKQALRKYGFLRGLQKSLGRILRCNPWNQGGVDYP